MDTPSKTNPGAGEDRDALLTRLRDARALPRDWLTLRDTGRADAAVFDELHDAQRDVCALEQAMAGPIGAADRVDVPVGRAVIGRLGGSAPWARPTLGWALAAALGLAWVTQLVAPARPGSATNTAGLLSAPQSPDEALARYLDLGRREGRVVGEVPERMVVESRPAENGEGYEVFYIRQVLERALVKDLYREGVSDTGERVLVPAGSASRVRAGSGVQF